MLEEGARKAATRRTVWSMFVEQFLEIGEQWDLIDIDCDESIMAALTPYACSGGQLFFCQSVFA